MFTQAWMRLSACAITLEQGDETGDLLCRLVAWERISNTSEAVRQADSPQVALLQKGNEGQQRQRAATAHAQNALECCSSHSYRGSALGLGCRFPQLSVSCVRANALLCKVAVRFTIRRETLCRAASRSCIAMMVKERKGHHPHMRVMALTR